MTHVVYEEWQDGFVIVDEEAYLPGEYDRHAKRCPVCERRFMVIVESGERSVAATRYCSDDCRRAINRQRSRAYMERKRSAA